MKQTPIRRGDVFWVNYDPSQETEIQKTRPSVIISHDMMNDKFTRVIVAPITSNIKKVYAFDHKLYDHPKLMGKVLLHQLRTVDKSRVGDKICSLSIKEMHKIDLIIPIPLFSSSDSPTIFYFLRSLPVPNIAILTFLNRSDNKAKDYCSAKSLASFDF